MKKYLVSKDYISNISKKGYFKSIFSDIVFCVKTKQKLKESDLVKKLKKGEHAYVVKEDLTGKVSIREEEFFNLAIADPDFFNLIFCKSKYKLPESDLLIPLERKKKGKYKYKMSSELYDKSSFACFCKLAKMIGFEAISTLPDGYYACKAKYKLPELEGTELID